MRNRATMEMLFGYVNSYRCIAELWDKAKQGIKAPLRGEPDGATFILKGYEVEQEERDDGSAIYFRLFGARCYVAFTHDLSKGRLEYGVIDPKDSQERRRIEHSALEFDVNANLREVGQDKPMGSIFEPHNAQAAHLTWISKIAPELVKTFYDAYHAGEPSE